jgi:beta-galactosidase
MVGKRVFWALCAFAAATLLTLQAPGWEADAPRLKLKFNSGWRFFRGDVPEAALSAPDFDDSSWESVHLPHSPKILPLRPAWPQDNAGINWYRKLFRLPEAYRGRKLFLEFEGADQVADVWVNGAHLLTHEGAYLPFTVDITELARFGGETNVVVLRVDNHPNPDIPGYGGWVSFGGLYRDVWLHVTDKLHITDPVYADRPASGGVFVTYPFVSDSLAVVQVKTHVLNEHARSASCTLHTRLLDLSGREVASAVSTAKIPAYRDYEFIQTLEVKRPSLWHPNHPHLYSLRSEVQEGGESMDVVVTRIGIRRIEFRRDGFYINGERLVFMGANRVQEYPYVSWAVPNSAQRRDALRLKEAGFQYVRCSHNPQDPSFLDACDELGLLVMDCIPGFQFIGGPKFRENSFRNMRDMIRRDRNHPCVVLWELSLNETEYDSDFARMAMRIGHEEYPGDQCYVGGWKFPEIYDVFLCASQHGARDYRGKTPLVISEYGHWDYGGPRSTSDVDRRDGEEAMLVQARNHWESLNRNRSLPHLCGDGLWVAVDFQRFPSGVIDYFRIPKFSYFFYQSQRDPGIRLPGIDSGPMVYIANYWTESSPGTVTVFTNCERVDLYLNGRLVATRRPDSSEISQHLLHPPVIFPEVPKQPGELKAVGWLGGKKVAEHRRRTPGPPKRLEISFEMPGPALGDGEDLFFVYAAVVDANGTVVPNESRDIEFTVDGSGFLASPPVVTAEAGIAAALVRTTTEPGTITVRARAAGLEEARATKACVPVN